MGNRESGTLITRDEFRNAVLKRDQGKCVWDGRPAVDAHHIMERRLFRAPDELGGYFLDNGASVCAACHLDCESTEISVEDIRAAAGIKKIILPSHLYSDVVYDKWGNIILPNGSRLKGELFYDESVQKVLKEKLNLFVKYVKYPRTFHLPQSPGMNEDDRQHRSIEQWLGKEIIITLKMDGENTTLYNDHIHARSLDSRNHPSRNWVKNFWANIAHDIPENFRICGENLYARHSIEYNSLLTYFYGFSVWQDNICLGWDETLIWFNLLNITPVPYLFRGIFKEGVIEDVAKRLNLHQQEGFVLRPVTSFKYSNFNKMVGKWVRPHHIMTTKHWMRGQPIVKNGPLVFNHQL